MGQEEGSKGKVEKSCANEPATEKDVVNNLSPPKVGLDIPFGWVSNVDRNLCSFFSTVGKRASFAGSIGQFHLLPQHRGLLHAGVRVGYPEYFPDT